MDIIKELEERGKLSGLISKEERTRIEELYKRELLQRDIDRYKEEKVAIEVKIASLEAKK